MHFARVFFLAFLAVSSLAATLSNLKTHITTISSRLNTLENIKQKHTEDSGFLYALDLGGRILEAHNLHTQAMKIASALDEATAAIKTMNPSQLSAADAQSIFTSVQAMQPVVVRGLNLMVDRKDHPVLKSMSGGRALVRRDVVMVSTSAGAFGSALRAILPGNLGADLVGAKSKTDEAFYAAIAAYQ